LKILSNNFTPNTAHNILIYTFLAYIKISTQSTWFARNKFPAQSYTWREVTFLPAQQS